MPTGLEEAAAAAGFMSLAISLFKGCIVAFEFAKSARNIGKDGEKLSAELAWEQFRLTRWGQRVGALDNQTPDQRLNWPEAEAQLRRLQMYLVSAEKLKERYQLEVYFDPVREGDADPEDTQVDRQLAALDPSYSRQRAAIIRASNSTRTQIRWASTGKKKLRQLAGDIREIIDRLEELLGQAERAESKAFTETCLRTLIALCSNSQAVDEIQDILRVPGSAQWASLDAVSRLKQTRYFVETGRSDAKESKTAPKAHHVRYDRLKPVSGRFEHRGLELAAYRTKDKALSKTVQKPVLIEWRRVDDMTLWPLVESRIIALSMVLAEMTTYESFHSLQCLGFVWAQPQHALGLAFAFPEPTSIPSPQPGEIIYSLRSLIEKATNEEDCYVSITARRNIALAIAESIRQIHTAGWLHKNIRSENVIFFGKMGMSDIEILSQPPIVVGYGYARDDSVEAAKFTELPDVQFEADIYRHPEARGMHRESFEQKFDLYALGCVLLEIAMWTPLDDIQRSLAPGSGNGQISLVDYFVEHKSIPRLHHVAGDRFAGAIYQCFSESVSKSTSIGISDPLARQNAIVRALEDCRF